MNNIHFFSIFQYSPNSKFSNGIRRFGKATIKFNHRNQNKFCLILYRWLLMRKMKGRQKGKEKMWIEIEGKLVLGGGNKSWPWDPSKCGGKPKLAPIKITPPFSLAKIKKHWGVPFPILLFFFGKKPQIRMKKGIYVLAKTTPRFVERLNLKRINSF